MARIIKGNPPNIKELRAKFPVRPGTIFAYGDVIFNPSGGPIPQHLLVHESTHFEQQRRAGGPEAWWRRYIDDPEFRLEQELEAYRAQWAVVQQFERPERRRILAWICRDLASGMYGSMVSKAKARELVTA